LCLVFVFVCNFVCLFVCRFVSAIVCVRYSTFFHGMRSACDECSGLPLRSSPRRTTSQRQRERWVDFVTTQSGTLEAGVHSSLSTIFCWCDEISPPPNPTHARANTPLLPPPLRLHRKHHHQKHHQHKHIHRVRNHHHKPTT
jgi:hypothetical protein